MKPRAPALLLMSILVLLVPRVCSATLVTWQSTSETWYIGIDGPDSLWQSWSNVFGVTLVPGTNIIPTSLTITFDSDAVGEPADCGGTSYPNAVSAVTMQMGQTSFTTYSSFLYVGCPMGPLGGWGYPGDPIVQFIFQMPVLDPNFYGVGGNSVYVGYWDVNAINGKLPIYPTGGQQRGLEYDTGFSQFLTDFNPQVVPEPSSIILLATGFLGLSPLTRRAFQRRARSK
jgi:hypothetical protein